MIKGHLVNELVINKREIEDHPIFVGGKSEANIRAGIGIDESNLYVDVIGIDPTPVIAEEGKENGDGIYLYIDAANLSLLDVDAGMSKFWISSDGEVLSWDGKEGSWIPGSANGIEVSETKSEAGYKLSIAISKDMFANFSDESIRLGVGFTDFVNENEGTTELLSLCEDMRSSTWLEISF